MVTDAKRRIVERLLRLDGATAPELAGALGLTTAAIRQHLDALAAAGLAEASDAERTGGRGRPPQRWRLTALAASLFPDRHADLTVELLDLVRAELGADALDRLVDARAARHADLYAAALAPASTVVERAERLAAIRSAEGYEAEAVPAPDGDGVLLVEHHCPICDAATACQGLCRAELDTFRAALGAGVEVEREQHLLAGDSRCTYRIRVSRTVSGR